MSKAPAIHVTHDLRPGPVPALFRRWTGWLAARNWYRAANLCQRVGWFTVTRVRMDWVKTDWTPTVDLESLTDKLDWTPKLCKECGEPMVAIHHVGKDTRVRDDFCQPCEDARAEAGRDAN